MALPGLLDLLERHPDYQRYLKLAEQRSIATAANPGAHANGAGRGRADGGGAADEPGALTLRPGARPAFIASLWRRQDGAVAVVSPRPDDARRLHSQLLDYLGETAPVYLLPEPEVLPFERLSVDANTGNERLQALNALAAARRPPDAAPLSGERRGTDAGRTPGDGRRGADAAESEPPPLVVASIGAALRFIPPPELLAGRHPALPSDGVLRVGDRVRIDRTLAHWVALGYRREPVVESPGEFSHRGGILDLYPPHCNLPVRLELFDDEIDAIRYFDPATQRSVRPAAAVQAIPAREQLPGLADAGAVAAAMAALDFSRCNAEVRERIEEELAALAEAPNLETLAFYNGLVNHSALPEYLGGGGLLLLDRPGRLEAEALELEERFERMRVNRQERGELPGGFPAPYMGWAQFAAAGQSGRWLGLQSWVGEGEDPIFQPATPYYGKLEQWAADLRRRRDEGAAAVAVTQHGARLAGLLEEQGIPAAITPQLETAPAPGQVCIVPGALRDGWTVLLPAALPPTGHSAEAGAGAGRANGRRQAATAGGGQRMGNGRGVGKSGGPAAASRLDLLTDAELFGTVKERRRHRPRRAERGTEVILADLTPGAFVVHIDHGVARFAGTIRMDAGRTDTAGRMNGAGGHGTAADPAGGKSGGQSGDKTGRRANGSGPGSGRNGGGQAGNSGDGGGGSEGREYLVLEYADGDKLYVPTNQLDRVSAYVGAQEHSPNLTRLSTTEWSRVKHRVKESAREMAQELIRLNAQRQLAQGHEFTADTLWQQELEDAFPFVETPDQSRAISEVKADMEQPQPMDRLICGDVGYGKTEVALRAAFKTVNDGMQVGLLVPTTVLAQQHYATFTERLSPYPVRVEVLSRFRTPKEQQQVVAAVGAGEVDIVIGTHRLLQKDVRFKNLGLAIIDEEQRFGVGHKERLKQLRRQVDVLTLSATPIPRTLNMALAGLRDLSTMASAPEARLPVKTFVSEYSDEVIKEAILREMERGGQIFFLHNRVRTIHRAAAKISELAPSARVMVGHGQMAEAELEEVMVDFANGEADVLVCTTIIESGLDMPNVNTMIIERADNFGLAQLYQLRGRVGRSEHRAYAYLLTPAGRRITGTADQRLQAILEASDLGSGFRIAMRDLEIRGAGNVLGADQSGHIHEVGLELYTQLLREAIRELEREPGEPAETPSDGLPRVELPLDAVIPESYIEHLPTRLSVYQRLARMTRRDEAGEIRDDLRDRFGPVPEEVENLLAVAGLRALAAAAGAESVIHSGDSIVITLRVAVGGAKAPLQRALGPTVQVGNTQLHLAMRRLGSEWQPRLTRALERLKIFHDGLLQQLETAAANPG